MFKVALTLACLACAGQARKVHAKDRGFSQEDSEANLAQLLLALNPALAFKPSAPGALPRARSVSRLTRAMMEEPEAKPDAGIAKAEPKPKQDALPTWEDSMRSMRQKTDGLTVDQDGKNNMWSTQSSKMTFKEEEKVGLQKYGDLLGSVLIIALLLPLFPIIFAGNEDQVGFN
mmetsp:Transcript_115294/g.187851  ORF Transcript_115294/g.187851 Transcript_115294/m.187851 type:complete len:174 (-) Transcript_115294:48-569(-)